MKTTASRRSRPSPVAAGATMAPLLLSDFERIYEASADALRVAGPGDHGVALHRREGGVAGIAGGTASNKCKEQELSLIHI